MRGSNSQAFIPREARVAGGCDFQLLRLLLLEVAQIGRRLVLLQRHEIAVLALIVRIPADADHGIVFSADRRLPHRARIGHAAGLLGDGPGPRQRAVDYRYVVIEDVTVGLVEMNALLDDRLIVVGKRQAGTVIDARALEAAGLDLERAVAPLAGRIDPAADGIAGEGALVLALGRPVAAVGVDAPVGVVDVADQDIGGLARDHDLHRIVEAHHHRHALRQAIPGRHVADPARLHAGQIVLVDGAVLGRQRRVVGLALPAIGTDALPLPLEIRIFRQIVERPGAVWRHRHHGGREGENDRASIRHRSSPYSVLVLNAPAQSCASRAAAGPCRPASDSRRRCESRTDRRWKYGYWPRCTGTRATADAARD